MCRQSQQPLFRPFQANVNLLRLFPDQSGGYHNPSAIMSPGLLKTCHSERNVLPANKHNSERQFGEPHTALELRKSEKANLVFDLWQ